MQCHHTFQPRRARSGCTGSKDDQASFGLDPLPVALRPRRHERERHHHQDEKQEGRHVHPGAPQADGLDAEELGPQQIEDEADPARDQGEARHRHPGGADAPQGREVDDEHGGEEEQPQERHRDVKDVGLLARGDLEAVHAPVLGQLSGAPGKCSTVRYIETPNPMIDKTNAAHGRHVGTTGQLVAPARRPRRTSPSRQLSFMETAALCVPGAEHTAAGWFPVMAQIDAVR